MDQSLNKRWVRNSSSHAAVSAAGTIARLNFLHQNSTTPLSGGSSQEPSSIPCRTDSEARCLSFMSSTPLADTPRRQPAYRTCMSRPRPTSTKAVIIAKDESPRRKQRASGVVHFIMSFKTFPYGTSKLAPPFRRSKNTRHKRQCCIACTAHQSGKYHPRCNNPQRSHSS
jgi:hypothetical protein